jgi:hypothetical protein
MAFLGVIPEEGNLLFCFSIFSERVFYNVLIAGVADEHRDFEK